MQRRPRTLGWLGVLVVLWGGGLVRADSSAERQSGGEGKRAAGRFSRWRGGEAAGGPAAGVRLNLADIPAEYQAKVRAVLERPTLHARGPEEAFHCQPRVYHWLLDHPDRAVKFWRKLGAKCAEITDRGNGRFGWRDGDGSDVYWDTVVRGRRQRVWYAEGVVKPGVLLPSVSVRAVFVLHLTEGKDSSGRPALRHRGELLLRTDSRAANLAARLLGPSAPRMAEDYIAQIETFYAALAWYLNEHPERVKELMGE